MEFQCHTFQYMYPTVTFRQIPQIIGPFINSGAIPVLTLDISVIKFVDFVGVRL